MTNREKDARLHELLGHRVAKDAFEMNDWIDALTCDKVPLYCTDIAAAFQAEGVLPETMRGLYVLKLKRAANSDENKSDLSETKLYWWFAHATAEQRVNAMLAALEPTREQR